MAQTKNGILGAVIGTVGTVTGSSWRGIDYIRSRAGKRRGGPSEKQLEQQARFAVMTAFAQVMKAVLQWGFQFKARSMTAMNSALGFNLKHAVKGQYPHYSIDYAQVQISRGSLPNVSNVQVNALANGIIQCSWQHDKGLGKAQDTDNGVLVVYCEALQNMVFSTGILRNAETATIQATAFAGHTVHTWISFMSADARDIATSIYTGSLHLPTGTPETEQ